MTKAFKITPARLRVLKYVRDHQGAPEGRDRAVADALHDAGLVVNCFSEYGVWLIGDDGREAIAQAERA